MQIDVHDALVLTRGTTDSRHGAGLTVEVWATSSAGPLRLLFPDQRATMYVDRELPGALLEGIPGRRAPSELVSMRGRPLDALRFESEDVRRRARNALVSELRLPEESDVRPADRFLMERFITASMAVRGRGRALDGYIELVDPQIEPSDAARAPRMLSFDVETDGLSGPLLSIAIVHDEEECVFMRGEGPVDPRIVYVKDERALVGAFERAVRSIDPDVLVGWNVVGFDLTTLVDKARALGTGLRIGRRGRAARVIPPRDPSQPAIARVEGRVVMDGVATLRAATYRFESYSLEEVSQAVLGRGKTLAHEKDPVAAIRRLYREDKLALAAYNLTDARLAYDIFAARDLLGFAVERQRLTGLLMDRHGGSVAAFDYLYLPRLHQLGVAAPDVSGSAAAHVPSPGGYVFDSEPGLYDNVLVLDFKSLYPSIIRTFLIDPYGLAFPGDDPVEGFDGARFSRETHVLPGVIAHLAEAREAAKRAHDTARGTAIKILMNSFYGVLGTPGCRFFEPKLVSSITRRGHEILRQSRAFVEQKGFRIIYGDTDSLFVHADKARSIEESRALGASIARELNESLREHVQKKHRLTSHLEVQFERHFARFFMPTIRGSDKGSKKRYAGLVRDPNGESELVVRGLEAVRTDWTPLARRFQRELLLRVLEGKRFEEYVRELAAQVQAGHHDDELVYRKRLRRSVAEYAQGLPPHVRAAQLLGGERQREIRYVMTMAGPQPIDMATGPLDYDHYLERQLAPAADTVIAPLGRTFKEITSPQLCLF